tara:strand:- start:1984 stop:2877 length:894 start_codon:yes stop_codon:yes gene_type:complete
MTGAMTTIDTNNYAGMAKAMGMAIEVSENKKTNTLARLKIQHSPIMGEMEIDGKTVNVETIQGGAFKLDVPEDNVYYSDTVTIRPFLQRFMYKRFVANTGAKDGEPLGQYHKTIMSDNLNVDLKDNFGGFNCGKPAGYIQDFDSLPEKTKELIKQIKRVRVLFGLIDMPKAMDSNKVDMEIVSKPFIWEIDNRDAFKIVGQPFAKLAKMKRLPIQHVMSFSTEERKLPNGNAFYLPKCDVDTSNQISIGEKDQDMFADFMAWVQNYNDYINSEWDKRSASKSSEDYMEVVDTFVDVE